MSRGPAQCPGSSSHGSAPGWSRVQAVGDWVHEHIRYEVGVVPPDLPMDSCSWLEVWLDGRWWTFDPRNDESRVGRVVIARGRDALDGAMVTTWGAAALTTMEVWADEVS